MCSCCLQELDPDFAACIDGFMSQITKIFVKSKRSHPILPSGHSGDVTKQFLT